MGDLLTRLRRAETQVGTDSNRIVGSLDVKYGQRPIDVLQAADKPGLWMLFVEDGNTLVLGRVSHRGKREIYLPGSEE